MLHHIIIYKRTFLYSSKVQIKNVPYAKQNQPREVKKGVAKQSRMNSIVNGSNKLNLWLNKLVRTISDIR